MSPQLVGMALSRLIVYACYLPCYRMANEFAPILNALCAVNASGSLVNYSINGFSASLVLVLRALCCLQG